MDYFSVKQSYYTGNFAQVLKEIVKQEDQTDATLLFYKARALLALGKYESQASSGAFGKVFDAYTEFLKSKNASKLEKLVVKDDSTPFELFLIAAAKAILGDYESSLNLCVQGIDSDVVVGSAELLLLAIEVALLNSQSNVAVTMFENYTNANGNEISSEDELIINIAESYIKFATNKDTTTSNYYQFEELAQSFPTWKTQLSLLNSHLQQGNIDQAEEIVNTLESDYYSVEQKESAELYNPHFLASKITLSIMQGSANTDELRNELTKLAPTHSYSQNNKEINTKFNELVAKYSS
ncbi:hypothetical protein Kpol_411p3 [Vanderwaltozyma polyspora DSM 70294]|uniref:Coatomer subunit epsilon n=1 Tax=Vanderwaltozyma polyspora (strain ATCC 22028 / DSM 70294 / BCRC 21397 / CBS 2163 / NBRC 10782 / NRRL Y-8283 / UCD 57-17) TaxID=436907 RepID=A7TRN6_VANPO|nr:uncharacterized protein Kpol_411p3 [Vanderwaltozyma polyspora DSM 70294]EDO15058.1 hypothetical protein Kpol_411p3 [Vanderwaltozyma polyspora DSM 70294]